MHNFIRLLFGDSDTSVLLRILGVFLCVVAALVSSGTLTVIFIVLALILMFSKRSNFNLKRIVRARAKQGK